MSFKGKKRVFKKVLRVIVFDKIFKSILHIDN